jgi:hypothetical protein
MNSGNNRPEADVLVGACRAISLPFFWRDRHATGNRGIDANSKQHRRPCAGSLWTLPCCQERVPAAEHACRRESGAGCPVNCRLGDDPRRFKRRFVTGPLWSIRLEAKIQIIDSVSNQKEQIVVFLAITPTGLADALRVAADSDTAVWCGADAISRGEEVALGREELSRFSYGLGTRDPEVLESALGTIGQHHPGEVVWVEAAPTAD